MTDRRIAAVPYPQTGLTSISTLGKNGHYTESVGTPLMRASNMMSLPRVAFLSMAFGLSVLSVACSTGKPRPARIRSELVSPDTSGRTIYLTVGRDDRRDVDARSYVLGQRAIASVGESIVEVRNYTVDDRAVRAVFLQNVRQTCGRRTAVPRGTTSSESVPCSGPLAHLDIPAGSVLNVAGGFEEDGVVYYLLAHEAPDGTIFLATDRQGRLKRSRYAAWRDAKSATVVTQLGTPLEVIEVSDPLEFAWPIVRYETEEVVTIENPKFVHFQLDYAGMSHDHRGETWHLLYKEYRRNPPGSPIFTKRLDYTDVGSSINLLGLEIQIHDVTPSYLTYTVVSD